jgi:hypothetical protein
MINAYNILVGKPKKKPFEKLRRRQDDNIKMDLKETGREDVGGFNWLRIGYSGGFL